MADEANCEASPQIADATSSDDTPNKMLGFASFTKVGPRRGTRGSSARGDKPAVLGPVEEGGGASSARRRRGRGRVFERFGSAKPSGTAPLRILRVAWRRVARLIDREIEMIVGGGRRRGVSPDKKKSEETEPRANRNGRLPPFRTVSATAWLNLGAITCYQLAPASRQDSRTSPKQADCARDDADCRRERGDVVEGRSK